VTKSKRIV